ncbi:hypothetical protein [Phaeobacter sp. 22II1-1F12B]|uniref:hypothetical protein n=1 Tax=Phaeobacter sp. 22II1-1F12B TaxID=1317111 RepID=UPI0013035A39|nr:hypothetical protein [Phaeobacter sp. 22II1-1F12B]
MDNNLQLASLRGLMKSSNSPVTLARVLTEHYCNLDDEAKGQFVLAMIMEVSAARLNA